MLKKILVTFMIGIMLINTNFSFAMHLDADKQSSTRKEIKVKFRTIGNFVKDKNDGKRNQKIDAIKKSFKKNGKNRLLIKSTDTQLETTIKNNNPDVDIHGLGNGYYMITTSKESNFSKKYFSEIEKNNIPESVDEKYEVVLPDVLQVSSEFSGESLDKMWWITTGTTIGTGTQKIKIGVIDSGIYKDHIDLQNVVNSTLGYDFVNDDTDANDDNGHGTHVAGLIGGAINGRGIFGVNPNVEFVPLKVVDRDGLGTSYDLLEAINYAKNNGIKILNISLAGYGNPVNSSICAAISDAKNAGVVSVVAAGNYNEDVANYIPAGCADSITVGALDKNLDKASFSNYGSKVNLWAPGVEMYSSWNDGTYLSNDGSSASSALVAGVFSSIMSQNPSLSNDQIYDKLKEDLSGGVYPKIKLNLNQGSSSSSSVFSGTVFSGNVLSGSYLSGYSSSKIDFFTGKYYSGLFLYNEKWYGNSYYGSGFDFPQSILDEYGVKVSDIKPEVNNGETKIFSIQTNNRYYPSFTSYSSNPGYSNNGGYPIMEDLMIGGYDKGSKIKHSNFIQILNQSAVTFDSVSRISSSDAAKYNVTINTDNTRYASYGGAKSYPGNMTMCSWYNRETFPTADSNLYIWRQYNSTNTSVIDDTTVTSNGNIKVRGKVISSISANTWFYWCSVFNNSGWTWYKDGEQVYTTGHGINFDTYYGYSMELSAVQNGGINIQPTLKKGKLKVDDIVIYPFALVGGDIDYLFRYPLFSQYNWHYPKFTSYSLNPGYSNNGGYPIMEDLMIGGYDKGSKIKHYNFVQTLNQSAVTFDSVSRIGSSDAAKYNVTINTDNTRYASYGGAKSYSGDMTLCSWYNRETFPTSDSNLYIWRQYNSNNNIADDTSVTNNGNIKVRGKVISSISTNTWFYWCSVFNHSRWTWYKNGEQVYTTGHTINFNPYYGYSMELSAVQNGGMNIQPTLKKGKLKVDDVVIYPFALVGNDINYLYLYNLGKVSNNTSTNLLTGFVLPVGYNYVVSPVNTVIGKNNQQCLNSNSSIENVKKASEADPVNISNGEFTYNNTLMSIPGNKLPYEFNLDYKSKIYYNGPVGINWDHNYNIFLTGSVDDKYYYDGKLGMFRFPKTGGVYEYNKGLKANLTSLTNGQFVLNFDNGNKYYFGTGNNKISKLQDRFGNNLRFEYNTGNLLNKVYDTLGRQIDYSYYDHNRLNTVSDFNGKKVKLVYFTGDESTGNVYDVKKISIDNGTGFVKDIKFTYTTGDNILGHNMKKLIDSKGQTYVENVYTGDLVLSQKYGTGTVSYSYTFSGTNVLKNYVTTRSGTHVEYTFDSLGNTIQIKTYDNDGVGSSIQQYIYDEDGRLVKEIRPRGNGIKYSYDSVGNMSEKRFKAYINDADSSEDLVTAYQYTGNDQLWKQTNPDGSQLINQIDSNGNIVSTSLSGLKDFENNSLNYTTSYEYNTNGLVTKVINPAGNIVRFQYLSGQVSQTFKGTGTNLITGSYEYNAYGNLLKSFDSYGNLTQNSYNAYNQLISSISPKGTTKQFSYDLNNNKTQEKLLLSGGVSIENNMSYDILDNVAFSQQNISSNSNLTKIIKYDNNGNMIEERLQMMGSEDFRGLTRYSYDEFDKVIEKRIIVDPADSSKDLVTKYEYDRNNDLVKETDSLNNETVYEYNLYDRLIKKTDPQGNYVEYLYDKVGHIVQTKSYNTSGVQISRIDNIYDSLGRVIQTSVYPAALSEPIITKVRYDGNGKIIQSYDAKGNLTINEYDILGRLIKTTDALGNESMIAYDKNDRVVAKTLGGKTTNYEYDLDGRLIKERFLKINLEDSGGLYGSGDVGGLREYTYNEFGKPVRIIDENGNIKDMEYNYAGKVTKLKEYLSGGVQVVTNYEYDVYGNMTKLIDAKGNETTYEYNNLNQLVKQTYPDGKYMSYTYDKLGHVKTKTDPNGNVVTNNYDSLGRLINKQISMGEGVGGVSWESYEYDAEGKLLSGTDSQGNQLNFEYDGVGRLLKEFNGGEEVDYNYDVNGNVISRGILSGDFVNYQYDNLDRLTQVDLNNNSIGYYSYTGILLQGLTYGNGMRDHYNYDNLNRVGEKKMFGTGGNIWKEYEYGYDNIGNILSDGEKNYSYDNLYRLTQVVSSQSKLSSSYVYDNMGNRVSENLSGNVINYNTNELNQYTGINSVEYKYDNNGNLVDNGKYKFKYDYKNRLIEVGTGESIISSYKYDVLGRRIEKRITEDGVGGLQKIDTYTYVYSNEDVILEKKNGVKIANNVYGEGIDNILASVRNLSSLTDGEYKEYNFCKERVMSYTGEFVQYGWTGIVERCDSLKGKDLIKEQTTLYYHKNNVGSVIGLSDDSGRVRREFEYDGYGKVYVKDGGNLVEIENYKGDLYGNSRYYTGRELDSETNLYYYRARYYDANLGRFISRDPIDVEDDINLYSYVGNNPIMFVDPMGREKSMIGAIYNDSMIMLYYGLDGINKGLGYLGSYLDAENIINAGKNMKKYGMGGVGAGATICAGGVMLAATTGGISAAGGCVIGGATAGAGVVTYGLGSVMQMVGENASNGDSNGGGSGNSGKSEYNYNQDKQLNNGEIDKLKKSGIDVHKYKPNSKFDLFKDKKGEIYYKRKTGKGYSDPEYIDLNINNF